MANMFISSIKGQSKLKLGYPVIGDKYNSKPFILDPTTAQPVALGTAVMATAVQGTHVAVKDSEVTLTADNINKFIGFILGNNATVPHTFPADGPDMVYPGQVGAVCVDGAVAVKFVGETLPEEEDEVYIVTASTSDDYAVGDIVDGTEVENVTKIELEGWTFMGISDTDEGATITAVHKGY